jgi:hypothetical protein
MERLLILGTSAVVFLCVGVAMLILATTPPKRGEGVVAPPPAVKEARRPPISEAQARQALDEALASAPEYAEFFARFAQAFPVDYAAATAAFKARIKAVGHPDSADYYVSEAIRLLRKSQGGLVAKAEPGSLARVFDAQLAVMRAMAQESPRMCVGFLYGATSQDFEKAAASRRPLVAEMALARLEATANGQAKRIERGAPSPSDVKTLEKALAEHGLNETEIDVLIGGRTLDPPLADARLCAIGLTYLEALRAMPEAPRTKIYSLLLEQMARS